MPRLIVEHDLGKVRISRRANGACSCGADPYEGELQTFVASGSVARAPGGKLIDSGRGINMDDLWESSRAVRYRGLEVLHCESGHYYVNRAAAIH